VVKIATFAKPETVDAKLTHHQRDEQQRNRTFKGMQG
jgi:hypothetical protein